VPFPFTDLETTKRRPALVLARIPATALPPLVIVSMITSQVESTRLVGDCTLSRWDEAGLLHPSKARLAKVVSLEQRMVVKKLGVLAQVDRKGVRRELRKVLAAWFAR
jgi:mRNA interferase MazF